MPKLHLIAGPNGSGKSSFVRELREGLLTVGYDIPRVINPDEIAKDMNPHDPDAASLAAGREALAQRRKALAAGDDFAIETTFSGNSERALIAAAKAAGYEVTMTYIALNDVEDNLWRVDRRAQTEIRTVPAEDVRRRYERSIENVGAVAHQLDLLVVFDNSGKRFEHLFTMERGRIVALADTIPAWVERTFGAHFASARSSVDDRG